MSPLEKDEIRFKYLPEGVLVRIGWEDPLMRRTIVTKLMRAFDISDEVILSFMEQNKLLDPR